MWSTFSRRSTYRAKSVVVAPLVYSFLPRMRSCEPLPTTTMALQARPRRAKLRQAKSDMLRPRMHLYPAIATHLSCATHTTRPAVRLRNATIRYLYRVFPVKPRCSIVNNTSILLLPATADARCDKLAKRNWRDNATNHQASAEDQLDIFADSGVWRASGSDRDALLVPAIFQRRCMEDVL